MSQAELSINGQTTAVFAPRRFEADLNLILLGTHQDVWSTLSSWRPFADQLRSSYPQIDIYRVIFNQSARGRKRFWGLTDMPRKLIGRNGPRDFTVALVTRKGDLLWQTSGAYTPEKGGDLCAAAVEAQLIFGGRIPPKKSLSVPQFI
ncbi:MAG: hypothetical protein QNJ45_18680 [Ardenticatenaceae bacterium]|nr:hypothetical protein [Ardenticatenaceae bacterium]